MGQDVEVRNTVSVGDVFVIDTDRSITGQDGHVITPTSGAAGVPARLAERLFALGIGIDHVYVLSNTITIRRPGGWDEDTAGAVKDVTESFLRYYPDEEE